MTLVTSPKVVAFARQHFNCSTLEGVELEDFGGGGTAGSHWEQRVVGNELMAGYVNPSMPISGLTMSLLEGSLTHLND